MSIASLTWQARRLATGRLGLLPPYLGSRHQRLLFITDDSPLARAQAYPFWHHRAELASRYAVDIRELPLSRFEAGRNPYADAVDAVCFQSRFRPAPEALGGLAGRVRAAFPRARLAYLDWSPAADLRYAEPLNPYLSAYVKPQAVRERRHYRETLLGDTNLADYFCRRLRIALPLCRYHVPEDFWSKLWIGPHLAFSAELLPYFQRGFPAGARDLDLHARFGVQGAEWYAAMRQEALEKAQELEGRYRLACRERVPRRQYLRELFRSRLCFSPFGHGEVCLRDFEAMLAGSLLLKPDMSHLECHPDIFLPYETYVPLAWDFSDFAEKVGYYLSHEAEREAIARRAFALMRGYIRQGRFLSDVESLLIRLGLAGEEIPALAGAAAADEDATAAKEYVPVAGAIMARQFAPPAEEAAAEPGPPAMAPPRVLLSAYRCDPGADPAARIGWEWYRRLAERAPVTLATSLRNQAALEQAGAPLPNSTVIYIDTEWFAGPLRRLAGRFFKDGEPWVAALDFHAYDRAALNLLRRRRKAGARWDVAHQPTPVSPLAATRLHRLGLPVVLGPLNGGLRLPAAFPEIAKAEPAPTGRSRWLARLLDRWCGATRHARLILAATRATRDGLPAACRERCRSMLECGVDTDGLQPTPWPAPPSATAPLKLVCVADLRPASGVGMLLEAVARAAARSPVELAVVGTGGEEATLRAQAEGLEIGACVRFAGALDSAGVAAELARAHALCLPAVREASGAALLEAMAAARPVIALDYGAPAEIVDGEVGALIPATGQRSAVERLTWTLIDIMDAPEVWRLRGLAGRVRAEQRYGWNARIDAALALYQEALKAPV
jgi:glycosyltransferase involved in cell wall biosynthesis